MEGAVKGMVDVAKSVGKAKAETEQLTQANVKAKTESERLTKAVGKETEALRRKFDAMHKLQQEHIRVNKKMKEVDGGGILEGMGKGASMAMRSLNPYVAATLAAGYATNHLVDHSIKYNSVMASLPFSIDGAKKSAMGMVETFELSKMAIQANRLGVSHSSKDFERLTAVATKLALSLGTDVQPAIEDLVTGIGRRSPMILDNLGIKVREAELIYKDFAEANGMAVEEMTETQKSLAFNEAAFAAAEEAAGRATVQVSEFARAWGEAKVALKEGWSYVLTESEKDLDELFRKFRDFPDRVAEMPDDLAKAMALAFSTVHMSTNDSAYQFGAQQASSREAPGELQRKMGAALKELKGLNLENLGVELERLTKARETAAVNTSIAELEARAKKELEEQVRLEELKALAKKHGIKIAEFEREAEEEARRKREEEERAATDAKRKAEEAQARGRENALARIEAAEGEAARERDRMALAEVSRYELIARQEADEIKAIESKLKWAKSYAERLQLTERIKQAHHQAEMSRAEEDKRIADEFLERNRLMAEAVSAQSKKWAEERVAGREWEIEQELEQARMRVELLEAEGLDPFSARELELNAEREALEAKLAMYQRDVELHAQAERTKLDLEKVAHAQRLNTIAKDKAAKEQWKKTEVQVANTVMDTVGNMTSQISGHLAANQAAYGISEKALRKVKAVELVILGLVEQSKAAAAFASFNYPQGAMHQAAAILSFVNAGIIGSGAGAGGGGGGGGYGGGSSMPRGGGSSPRGGRQHGDAPEVPLSRPSGASGPIGASAPGSSSSSNSGGVVININDGAFRSLEAPDREEFIKRLRQEIDQSKRNNGRA